MTTLGPQDATMNGPAALPTSAQIIATMKCALDTLDTDELIEWAHDDQHLVEENIRTMVFVAVRRTHGVTEDDLWEDGMDVDAIVERAFETAMAKADALALHRARQLRFEGSILDGCVAVGEVDSEGGYNQIFFADFEVDEDLPLHRMLDAAAAFMPDAFTVGEMIDNGGEDVTFDVDVDVLAAARAGYITADELLDMAVRDDRIDVTAAFAVASEIG